MEQEGQCLRQWVLSILATRQSWWQKAEVLAPGLCCALLALLCSHLCPSRKAHLILRRLEKVSSHCSTLLRSAYIQSRTETMPYLFCRSEEVRPPGMVWYSILKDTKVTCEEKMVSMLRNTYGESKGR